MVAMSCGGNCMRMLLFVFNFIFWLSGVSLLSIGIWFKTDSDISEFTEIASDVGAGDELTNAANMCIFSGLLIFVIGFLGCCGACKASTWMLCGYMIAITVVVIFELVAIGLSIAYAGELDSKLEEQLTKQAEEKVGENIQNSFRDKAWALMQVKLECCGGKSYEDYAQNPNFNQTHPVPVSCCKMNNADDIPEDDPDPTDLAACYAEATAGQAAAQLHSDGCYGNLDAKLHSRGSVILGSGIFFLIVQILGIVFAYKVRKEILETAIA